MPILKIAKTVLKSMVGTPATKMYPIQKREYTKNTRGRINIEIENCIFCGICAKKCPTGAIGVVRADKKWEIERLNCIVCNACVENCPKKCLMTGNQYTAPSNKKEKEVHVDARVSDNTTNS